MDDEFKKIVVSVKRPTERRNKTSHRLGSSPGRTVNYHEYDKITVREIKNRTLYSIPLH